MIMRNFAFDTPQGMLAVELARDFTACSWQLALWAQDKLVATGHTQLQCVYANNAYRNVRCCLK